MRLDQLDRSLQGDLARTFRGLGDAQLMMRDVPAAIDSYRRSFQSPRNCPRLCRVTATRSETSPSVSTGLPGHWDSSTTVKAPTTACSRRSPFSRLLRWTILTSTRGTRSRAAYKALGGLRAAQGDYKESLALAQEALRLNEALALADPVNMTVRNEVAMSHFEVGRAHLRLGNLEEALGSARRAETITASMAATDASNAQARWLQGLELNFAGVVLTRMHRQAEAVASHLKALALLEGVARADPTNESYRYNVANTYQLIGDAYVDMAGASGSDTREVGAWMRCPLMVPTERGCVRRYATTWDAHWCCRE